MGNDVRLGRIAFARSLRRDATRAERLLWTALRDRRLGGLKFRRQVPIGPFTVDFYCHHRRLVIEVDGGHHCDSASDTRRDAWLLAQGFQVIRVWNSDVLVNRDGLVEHLIDRLGITPS